MQTTCSPKVVLVCFQGLAVIGGNFPSDSFFFDKRSFDSEFYNKEQDFEASPLLCPSRDIKN